MRQNLQNYLQNLTSDKHMYSIRSLYICMFLSCKQDFTTLSRITYNKHARNCERSSKKMHQIWRNKGRAYCETCRINFAIDKKKNRSPKTGCLAFLFWLVSTAENIIANILIKLRICWFWRYQQHKGSHRLIGWWNFPHGQRSSATLKVHLNDIFSSSGLANRARLSSRLIT